MRNVRAAASVDGKMEAVELQFTTTMELDASKAHIRSLDPAMIHRATAGEAFGRMPILRTGDGLLIKILEVDRKMID